MRRRLVIPLITVVALGVGPVNADPSSASAPRVRKSVTQLTSVERADFVAAVLAMKATPSPYDPNCPGGVACLSWYDQFVAWHKFLPACEATDPVDLNKRMMGHAGPMFLPWHREFLLLFEDALRAVSGKDISVPYWDWTDRRSVVSVFAEDFMGGNGDPNDGDIVKTGPFTPATWRLVVKPEGIQRGLDAREYLTRNFGSPTGLPSSAEVGAVLSVPRYDVPPYSHASDSQQSFRNALEGFSQHPIPGSHVCGPDSTETRVGGLSGGPHNLVHDWIGGAMGPNQTSPNDPVFFLHHANVDRIWALWQQTNGVDTYEPVSGFPNNEADSVMAPFDEAGIISTPRTVADNAQLGVTYTASGGVGFAATSVERSETAFACRLPISLEI